MHSRLRSLVAAPISHEVNRDAYRVRDNSNGRDFCSENQRARHVDDWINREENRAERNSRATDGSEAQPGRFTANSHGAEYWQREHREVNDAVKDVGGVVDELKRFLDAG